MAQVTIQNTADPSKKVQCVALVDTGASHIVLPSAWREQLGNLQTLAKVQMETATQELLPAEICGPAQIQIAGFRPVFSEVLFVEMDPIDQHYEPLIGYLVLEQCGAAVDVLGHRLVPVKHLDLK